MDAGVPWDTVLIREGFRNADRMDYVTLTHAQDVSRGTEPLQALPRLSPRSPGNVIVATRALEHTR